MHRARPNFFFKNPYLATEALLKLLVAMPSRGRPDEMERACRAWHSMASGQHQIEFRAAVDNDDDRLADYHRAAKEMAAGGLAFTLDVGAAGGKISAFNRSAWSEQPWDVLVAASDDFACALHGWDDVVVQAMAWHFPATDGLLQFSDGYLAETRIPTLPVVGRRLWERLGRKIFHEGYRAFFCDDELGDVTSAWGKRKVIDLVLARHSRLPGATLDQNERHWDADKALYLQRRRDAAGPQPALSILMPTLWSRLHLASPLLARLYSEIEADGRGGSLHDLVEVRTLLDQKRLTVGAKRDRLLRESRGKFICFLDDDDEIENDYVRSLLAAIRGSPQADCVVYEGAYYVDGEAAGRFDFDLQYQSYRNLDGFFERTPNHLCPVRRELALRAGFGDLRRGEDTLYARRLRPMLRTQAACLDGAGKKKVLYHYRYSPSATETQREAT